MGISQNGNISYFITKCTLLQLSWQVTKKYKNLLSRYVKLTQACLSGKIETTNSFCLDDQNSPLPTKCLSHIQNCASYVTRSYRWRRSRWGTRAAGHPPSAVHARSEEVQGRPTGRSPVINTGTIWMLIFKALIFLSLEESYCLNLQFQSTLLYWKMQHVVISHWWIITAQDFKITQT